MRVVFFGTPAFTLPVLDALVAGADRGWQVVGVVTQPDRPAGRSGKPQPPPVKLAALERGVPVFQPERLLDGIGAALLEGLRPDVGVLFSYAQLLPRSMLRVPRAGILNVHPSLLPRYRGPSPVQATILNGDAETGVSLIKLVAKMDAGPIVAQERVPMPPRATTPDLLQVLAGIGARLVATSLEDWVAGRIEARPQDEELATYCPILARADGWLDWTKTADELDRRVRALQPWPGTFTTWRGKQLKVVRAEPIAANVRAAPGAVVAAGGHWDSSAARDGDAGSLEAAVLARGVVVAAGSGCLAISELQLEGGRPLPADAFARGHPSLLGSLLGSPA